MLEHKESWERLIEVRRQLQGTQCHVCFSLIKLKCHWPSEAQNRNENMFGIMEFKLIPSTKKRNTLCSNQRKIR